jgi:hypothetical protein
MPKTTLYDEDFVAWTEQAASAVLSGRLTPELREQVAEEILDMGKRDFREGRNRLVVLLVHVLKCLCQPGRRTRSWYGTISTQRTNLNTLLTQSPSLRPKLKAEYDSIYEDARHQAAAETGLTLETFPSAPPLDFETALSQDYMPGAGALSSL